MATDVKAEDTNESVGDELGIAEGILEQIDPLAATRALASTIERAVTQPDVLVPALARFAARVGLAGVDVCGRALTGRLQEPVEAVRRDHRFADVAWSRNPAFRMMLETYLAGVGFLDDLVTGAHVEPEHEHKAQFAASLLADAAAPTNLGFTNPTALKRAFETGGASVVRGARNFVRDLVENDGWPSQVDRSAFELGENMAATPGKVVFRNELIEVIQYEAATPEVHDIPLVLCPPWINRYYIADLAPGKSLVEWAIDHGHTTFAISYRNPDESMREITFDDYLRLGPLTAIDVVRSISDVDTVNTVSICLGATLTTIALAYHEAVGDHLVNSSTLLNAALDYANSGALAGVFADERTVRSMCRRMDATGFLEAKEMTRVFSILRANDLVFRYVVDNWLLGEDPPAFDLLAWNADGTRMPGKAHARFLQEMYVENALANGTLEMLGEPIVLPSITSDHYVVAAVEDHIVPWQNSYRTTQLLKAPVRFVMTSAGHVAGIVNPPGPKAKIWVNDELPADPETWRAGATEHAESWWLDWARWMEDHAGGMRPARGVGSEQHPPLCDAPGTYVRS